MAIYFKGGERVRIVEAWPSDSHHPPLSFSERLGISKHYHAIVEFPEEGGRRESHCTNDLRADDGIREIVTACREVEHDV